MSFITVFGWILHDYGILLCKLSFKYLAAKSRLWNCNIHVALEVPLHPVTLPNIFHYKDKAPSVLYPVVWPWPSSQPDIYVLSYRNINNLNEYHYLMLYNIAHNSFIRSDTTSDISLLVDWIEIDDGDLRDGCVVISKYKLTCYCLSCPTLVRFKEVNISTLLLANAQCNYAGELLDIKVQGFLVQGNTGQLIDNMYECSNTRHSAIKASATERVMRYFAHEFVSILKNTVSRLAQTLCALMVGSLTSSL